MAQDQRHSWVRDLLLAIAAGVIVAFIIQEGARFDPRNSTPEVNGNTPTAQLVQPTSDFGTIPPVVDKSFMTLPPPTSTLPPTDTPPPANTSQPTVTMVFYSNDFEGTVGSEWSNTSVDTTPTNRSFLGQFGNTTIMLVLPSLPVHETIVLTFELFIIRSWDGNDRGQGPDIWNLTVDGGQTLLNTTFNANPTSPAPQAYPDAYPGGEYPPNTGAAEVGSLGYNFRGNIWNAVYELSFTFPHSEDILQLRFAGTGLQGLSDESWGIDNIVVELR